MNQVSRPMQIALAAVLVFAVLWFVALKPGDETEDFAEIPAATTPVDAGGPQAQSGVGQVVEQANETADAANQATAQREGLTGGEDPNAPSGSRRAAGGGGGSGGAAGAGGTQRSGDDDGVSKARQARADRTIRAIEGHLDAGRVVIFLVWQRSGTEDKLVNARVADVDRRGGRVRVYRASVADVGLYDGLIGDLNVSQTPSTVVIAPNKQAKVLGGLVSTVRLDRLASSALVTSERGDE